MLKRRLLCLTLLLLLMLLLMPSALSLQAQGQYGRCGYALIEGLPLLDNQLAVLEAITPPESDSINPAQLFQHRFNLSHTAVIIEGCWNVAPTREVVISLLTLVIPFDQNGMADTIAGMDFSKGQVTETDVVAAYIDDHLQYTIFAGTREESAAQVRSYLSQHLTDWELPEETP